MATRMRPVSTFHSLLGLTRKKRMTLVTKTPITGLRTRQAHSPPVNDSSYSWINLNNMRKIRKKAKAVNKVNQSRRA